MEIEQDEPTAMAWLENETFEVIPFSNHDRLT